MNHFELPVGDDTIRVTDPSYRKYAAYQNHLDMFVEYKECKPGTWWAWVEEKNNAFYAQHESTDDLQPRWDDVRNLNNDRGSVGMFPSSVYPDLGFDDFWDDAEMYESFPHGGGYVASIGLGPFRTASWTVDGEVVGIVVFPPHAPLA